MKWWLSEISETNCAETVGWNCFEETHKINKSQKIGKIEKSCDTVSPQMSKTGLVAPMTPQTRAPTAIPILGEGLRLVQRDLFATFMFFS